MSSFKTILIPVDFTINTDVAIGKALELSLPGFTRIVLLHVTDQRNIAGAIGRAEKPSRHSELESIRRLRDKTLENSHETEIQTVIISNRSVEAGVISYAGELRPDLIIIGKNNHHSFFPFLNTVVISKISAETGAAVLTVKPGSVNRKMETVVMPVCDYFPKRKIDLLANLGSRMKLNVHLLTILGSRQQPDNHSASALLQSMRTIRSRLQCPVQQSVVHSDNRAIATLRYAEKVKADILLVSDRTEATINSWINKKDLSDIVNPASQLQVLSVKTD
ncbi:MAG TPA: universal stress protein [Chitinophagaceae bacterium]